MVYNDLAQNLATAKKQASQRHDVIGKGLVPPNAEKELPGTSSSQVCYVSRKRKISRGHLGVCCRASAVWDLIYWKGLILL